LNFALSTTPPTVGSEPLPDTAYVTVDGGTLSQQTGWSPYSGAIEFSGQEQQSAVPEPSSLVLLGWGLIGLSILIMQRRSLASARSWN
jgi:hypothetical protein